MLILIKLLVCDVDLQGQLTQAEQHATQYKSIADSVESSLHEQSEASEQLRQTLETRITETVQGALYYCCYWNTFFCLVTAIYNLPTRTKRLKAI